MALSKRNLKDAEALVVPCEGGGVVVPPISRLVRIMRKDWGAKVYFGAVPYIDALSCVDTAGETVGCDNACYLIMYLLSNSTTWRGATARQVKAALKLHYEGVVEYVGNNGVVLK